MQLSDGRLIIPINVKGPGIDRTDMLVFVSNPSGRKMLASQISTDGGYTWSDLKQIEYVDTVRQFYSPAAYVDDDYAYILYCDLPNSGWSGGASVRLSKLPLDWFTDMDN